MGDSERAAGEAVERLRAVLQGRAPEKMDPEALPGGRERDLAETVNRLIEFVAEIHDFILPLARGELRQIAIRPGNFLSSPFKELHSRLLHLSWQAEQVAKGDFSQRIDFMGDFSRAFNAMVIALDDKEKALRARIGDLQEALEKIRRLEGILPVCMYCKKIRLEGAPGADPQAWMEIESYIRDRSEARFSHSICPDCARTHFPEV